MFCGKCGAENAESARFCLRCGAKLAGSDTSKWWEDRRVHLTLAILVGLILILTAAIIISAVLRPVPLLTPEPLPASSTAPASATMTASSENEPEDTPSAPPDELGTSNLYLEYILDASGSMNDPLPDGSIKLEVARELLSEHLQAFRPETNIGLCAYGHRVDYRQTAESCQDIELIAPMEQGQLETIVTWLREFQAQGMTPLAESIRIAMGDFVFEPERINAIVMISDGEETCDGDPCGLVEELKAQDINFTIHVVGLDVDEPTRKQLLCIARAGDGTYHDARSAEDLVKALDDIQETVTGEGMIVAPSVDTPTPLPTLKATLVAPTATPYPSATATHTASPIPTTSIGRIYFLSSREREGVSPSAPPSQAVHDLFVMDSDGGNQRRLSSSLQIRTQPSLVSVSPDSRTALILCQLDPTGYGLCTLDLRKPDEAVPISQAQSILDAAWSPDGLRIAYNLVEAESTGDVTIGMGDVYIMDSDGTNLRQLTDNLVRDWFPDWSPDGATLAYMHDYELWLMRADGTEKRRLIAGFARQVAWSPDGRMIAFESGSTRNDANPYNNMDIWVVNADGSNPRNLTNTPGVYDGNPSWSPDSESIVFDSIRWEEGQRNAQIWIVDVATGAVTQLTWNGNNMNPCWAR